MEEGCREVTCEEVSSELMGQVRGDAGHWLCKCGCLVIIIYCGFHPGQVTSSQSKENWVGKSQGATVLPLKGTAPSTLPPQPQT